MPVQVPKNPYLARRKSFKDSSDEASLPPVYTKEQKDAVEHILECEDYYDILEVSRDATDAQLRKQYRKLALQFHPDKNKAPGSIEAFKAIGNAFSVLTDPVKRKRYDMFGLEAMRAPESPQDSQQTFYTYMYSYDGELNPDDVQNIFFRGRQTFRRRTSHPYSRRMQRSEEEEIFNGLLQIVPIIVILAVSLLSSVFVTHPPYSLQKTSKYKFEQRTNNLDIPYYVQENFLNKYKNRIATIEKQVEDEYLTSVRTSCFRERNYNYSLCNSLLEMSDQCAPASAAPTPSKKKAKVSEMVNGAVRRRGSSVQAFLMHIGAHHKVDTNRLTPFIKTYSKSAVSSGTLIQTKGKEASGSFKFGASRQKAKKQGSIPAKKAKPKSTQKKKSAAKKPAAKKAAKKPAAKKASKKPAAKKASKKPAAKKAAKPKRPKKAAKPTKPKSKKMKTRKKAGGRK